MKKIVFLLLLYSAFPVLGAAQKPLNPLQQELKERLSRRTGSAQEPKPAEPKKTEQKPAPKPALKPAQPQPTVAANPEEAELQRALQESKKLAEQTDEEQRNFEQAIAASLREAEQRAGQEAERKKRAEKELQRILRETSVNAEAQKKALKDSGWGADDTKKRTAWRAYQTLLWNYIENPTWDDWYGKPEWNKLAAERDKIYALQEPSKDIEDAYLNAYGDLPIEQRKKLWTLIDLSISTFIGSRPITEKTLTTLKSIINDVRALSQDNAAAVQKLVAVMMTYYTIFQQALAKKYDTDLARVLTASAAERPTPVGPAEQKKKHEAEGVTSMPTSIMQVKTVWVPVRSQINATCGLHAVNNANEMRECLLKQIAEEQYKARMKAPLTGVPLILSQQQESNMLDPLTIQTRAHVLGIAQDTYSILPNVLQNVQDFTQPVPMATEQSPYIPAHLGRILEDLNTKQYFVHNFVLGTMMVDPIKKKGTEGHWIGVTAEKKGDTLTLYAMDSGGGQPQELVNALQAIITKANYYALQLTYNIGERIVKIKRFEDVNNFAGMLAEIRTIIDLARKAGILNNPAFIIERGDSGTVLVKRALQDYLNDITVLNAGNWAAQAYKQLQELEK